MLFTTYALPILQLVLAWPIVFFVTILIFKKQIGNFINDIIEVKWGDRTVTRRNTQKPGEMTATKKPPKASGTVQDSKWDYKLLYLDLFLVRNTIFALLWFYQNPGEHETQAFIVGFTLDPTTRSDVDEKTLILKVLLENDLLNLKTNKYSITKEGISYLKHKELIK